MSVQEEFSTVDAVLNTGAETLGVDAFALALIKVERQLRRLFTFLVYQSPSFGPTDMPALRKALANNTHIYLGGVIVGIEQLYPRSLRELVGQDYVRLVTRVAEATKHRNKIFHGQLTDHGLSRDDLLGFTKDLRAWCEAVALAFESELGYDGFRRNSFRKASVRNVVAELRKTFSTPEEYAAFLTTLERIQLRAPTA